MDPDRFQQVHKLFEAALEREPHFAPRSRVVAISQVLCPVCSRITLVLYRTRAV